MENELELETSSSGPRRRFQPRLPTRDEIAAGARKTAVALAAPFARFILLCGLVTLLLGMSIYIEYKGEANFVYTSKWTYDWEYQPEHLTTLSGRKADNYTVVLDGHSHTYYSDGSLNPNNNIRWHLANGFNATFVSDHNRVVGGQATREYARQHYNGSMVVLIASEWTSCRVHMNLLGIERDVPSMAHPTDEDLIAVIEDTHAQGGLVSINHRAWSQRHMTDSQPSLEQLREWGVDYIEVANGRDLDFQAYIYARETGMGVLAGTDMHRPTRGVNAWTVLSPRNFSEAAIWEELRAKRTDILFDGLDSPYYTTKSSRWTSRYKFYAPISELYRYVEAYFDYYTTTWSFNGEYCEGEWVNVHNDIVASGVFWLFSIFVVWELVVRVLLPFLWTKLVALYKRKRGKKFDGVSVESDSEELDTV